ncbi:elongator complex protein 5 [Culex quinquefasciatus]|uniref:elongator complex protein 5 n=1 Tax=Culex quinquefasciatus TaxID=7176 RepID=UPI0018E2E43D|nr:elongator complex protein 5 [Culex quinquefasciatus]
MLSSHMLNQQKIILIKDNVGIENTCSKIVQSWLKEQKGPDAVLTPAQTCSESAPFLLARISSLSRKHSPRDLFQFVNRCKQTVEHLFLWATAKNLPSESFLVPYLEHMAGLVVTFEDQRHLSVLTKKSGGSVSNKSYQYQTTGGSFSVKEVKKDQRAKEVAPAEPTIDPASLGTFKIGDLKREEQEAKDALTLPFEFYKTTPEGGKVLYHPDAEDDLDEEDPDDDLLI